MNHYLRVSLIYLGAALALTLLVRDDPSVLPIQILGSISGMGMALSHPVSISAVVGLCLVPVLRPATRSRTLSEAVTALAASFVFFSAFFLLKTDLPLLTEAVWGTRYAADMPLIALDRALHFGVDPWRFTHWLTGAIGWQGLNDVLVFCYTTLWIAPSILFPLFLALWENSQERKRRFLNLYVFSWIVLGNLLPFLFLAAGPVFVERMHGLGDFVPLTAALAESGMLDSAIGWQQDWLWRMYSENAQGIGTGISAFPSGHLALATVLTLYVNERVRPLNWIMVPFLLLTLFLSVHTGYHYAVDGYVAILAVWLMNRALAAGFPFPRPALTYRN